MKTTIAVAIVALFATTGLASASTAHSRYESHRGGSYQTYHHAGDNDMDRYNTQNDD